jgi:arylsulfatase A-like enzyme
MRIQNFLCPAAVIALLFSDLPALLAQAPGNVLLILADDLGNDALDRFNQHPDASFAPTPTIDSFADDGVMFTRAYAYPTCSPTRAAIMTGRYGFRTGVLSPTTANAYRLLANEFTLPEALIESGAISTRLACIGKWHLGPDASSPNTIGGWPHFSGALGGGLNEFSSWQKTVNGVSTNSYPEYATTDNVDDAMAWIGQQTNEPWFLWLAFNAPHTPLHLPPLPLHDYDSLPGTTGHIAGNPDLYFEAMIQAMDTEISRLLASIDLSATTVIFMGDNGTSRRTLQPPYPDGHSKGSVYEGGVRVPLIVTGKAGANGVKGTVSEELVHAVDLYATILQLFEVEPAAVHPRQLVLDSRSFLPIIAGTTYAPIQTAILAEKLDASESGIGDRAAAEKAFKVIRFEDQTTAFYNVASDPGESADLLQSPLSEDESSAYTRLLALLDDNFINHPGIERVAIAENGEVDLELGWFVDTFTLWQNDSLTDGTWQTVGNPTVIDDGGFTFTIRTPQGSGSANFYQVSVP